MREIEGRILCYHVSNLVAGIREGGVSGVSDEAGLIFTPEMATIGI